LLQLLGVPTIPLKVIELLPCEEPKFVPVIVTGVPKAPEAGFRVVIDGVTAKFTGLLAKPPTVTATPKVLTVRLFGTCTVMLVAFQLVGVAVVPLNVTVLVPCVPPKFAPVTVTELPTGPEEALRPVMDGVTVKSEALLATPPTVTTTLPVAAPLGTGTPMAI
jgi:hypothetical protein